MADFVKALETWRRYFIPELPPEIFCYILELRRRLMIKEYNKRIVKHRTKYSKVLNSVISATANLKTILDNVTQPELFTFAFRYCIKPQQVLTFTGDNGEILGTICKKSLDIPWSLEPIVSLYNTISYDRFVNYLDSHGPETKKAGLLSLLPRTSVLKLIESTIENIRPCQCGHCLLHNYFEEARKKYPDVIIFEY